MIRATHREVLLISPDLLLATLAAATTQVDRYGKEQRGSQRRQQVFRGCMERANQACSGRADRDEPGLDHRCPRPWPRLTAAGLVLTLACVLGACDANPVLDGLERSWNLWLWDFDTDTPVARSATVAGIEVIALADPDDMQRVDLAIETLGSMMDTVPISPAPELRELILVFGDENDGGALAEVNRAVTPVGRPGGTQYVFLYADADEHTVRHELIHAVWQRAASISMPIFVSEGAVYAAANPEPGVRLFDVEPVYLLGLAGVLPPSGELGQREVPADGESLQYQMMDDFWTEVGALDPALPYRVVALDGLPTGYPAMQDIPKLLQRLAAPAASRALKTFLDSCAIFGPPGAANLAVVPSVFEGHPEIVVYLLDSQLVARDEEVALSWMASGGARSDQPILLASNFSEVLEEVQVAQGTWLCVTSEHPLTGQRNVMAWEYTLPEALWVEVGTERCESSG